MKRIALILSLLICACSKPAPQQTLHDFLSTRAEAPLESTIWQHDTGERYDRFLYFHDAETSLFYGLIDDGEIQRWSDFYTAPYALENGRIVTSLTYPLWGESIWTENVSVVSSVDAYSILVDDERYEFVGTDASSLDVMWMTITVNIINPWE